MRRIFALVFIPLAAALFVAACFYPLDGSLIKGREAGRPTVDQGTDHSESDLEEPIDSGAEEQRRPDASLETGPADTGAESGG